MRKRIARRRVEMVLEHYWTEILHLPSPAPMGKQSPNEMENALGSLMDDLLEAHDEDFLPNLGARLRTDATKITNRTGGSGKALLTLYRLLDDHRSNMDTIVETGIKSAIAALEGR